MEQSGILANFIFHILGIQITESVFITWMIMIALILGALFLTRKLMLEASAYQVILEGAILAAEDAIKAILPNHVELVFPFIATLWIFILVANLIGLLPGMDSPTADLSVTSGLALLVFLSVHWFGIKAKGLKKYLIHYVKPNPLMLPFHIISEISRTLALAIRLFGNIISLQLVVVFVLMIAGFLVPVPLLILHIIEALIQAYIFGILALIYIAGGIQTQELIMKKGE